MRVMILIKATNDSEAGVLPSNELLTAMDKYNEDLAAAGVLVSGEGLRPSSRAKRVVTTPSGRSVTDGPFEPASSLVAGFWIWNVGSMDAAVEWCRRCPAPMPGEQTHLEMRPLFEMEDFGDEMTPELRQKEGRLRAELEAKERRTR